MRIPSCSEPWEKLQHQESPPAPREALLWLSDSIWSSRGSRGVFHARDVLCTRCSAPEGSSWAPSSCGKARIFTGQAARGTPVSLQSLFGVQGVGLEFSLSLSSENNREWVKAAAFLRVNHHPQHHCSPLCVPKDCSPPPHNNPLLLQRLL